MTKAAVFGIGKQFFEYENEIRNNYEIVCLADNDKNKHGNLVKEFKIISLKEMLAYDYDVILVIPNYQKMDIIKELENSGILKDRIIPWIPCGGNIWSNKTSKIMENDCLFSFDDIKFKCSTTSDFLCLEDVFIHNTYNFSMPGGGSI